MFDFKVQTYHTPVGVQTTAELQGADHDQSYLVEFDTCLGKGRICFITQVSRNPNIQDLICGTYPSYEELQRLKFRSSQCGN